MGKTITFTLKLIRSFPCYSNGNVTILCLLLLTTLSISGCPAGDPYTESRIVNKTVKAIQIELVLDKNKYGLEQSDATLAYAREWLEEFDAGAAVEILAIDTDVLSATYQIAASGFMIVHASLGTRPYFYFKKLVVTQGHKTLAFNNKHEIATQFRLKGDGNYRYEFQITDGVFNERDSEEQEVGRDAINSANAAASFDLMKNSVPRIPKASASQAGFS